MKFNFVLLLCIFLVSCSSFSPSFFTGRWYIAGEDVVLDFSGDELKFTENGFGLVVKASKFASAGKDTVYKVNWVSDNRFINKKYPIGSDIIFRGLIDSGDGKFNCLVSFSGLDFIRYYFSRDLGVNRVYYGDLLSSYERDNFLVSKDFTSLGSSYKVSVFSTLDDSSLSYNHLIDGNYRSYFSIKGFRNIVDNTFEFFFYDRDGKELSNDLRLRGVGFVLYPSSGGSRSLAKGTRGDTNKLKVGDSFHRLRSFRLEFAKDYSGGLSRSYGLYSADSMNIVLEDRGGLQVLYFFKDIYARGIRLKSLSIYPGNIDEYRLYELIFYIND